MTDLERANERIAELEGAIDDLLGRVSFHQNMCSRYLHGGSKGLSEKSFINAMLTVYDHKEEWGPICKRVNTILANADPTPKSSHEVVIASHWGVWWVYMESQRKIWLERWYEIQDRLDLPYNVKGFREYRMKDGFLQARTDDGVTIYDVGELVRSQAPPHK